MRSGLLCVAVSFFLIAAAACSGGGGSGSGPSAGHATGNLRVLAEAGCLATSASVANCPVVLSVVLRDSASNPVRGATVTMGAHGSTLSTLGTAGQGVYYGMQTGLAELYDLEVQSSVGSLTGVVLAGPGNFSESLAPNPPSIGSPASLSWTPSTGNSLVGVLADVLLVGTAYTFQLDQGPAPDNGALALPATAFPHAGQYQIDLTRGRVAPLAGQGDYGVVTISRSILVNLP